MNRLLYKQIHDTSPQFASYCYSLCKWHQQHKMAAPILRTWATSVLFFFCFFNLRKEWKHAVRLSHISGRQLLMLTQNSKKRNPVFLGVTDHDSIKVIPSPRCFVSPVFPKWLCRLPQGPAVHRDIEIGEWGELATPGPVLRCRKRYIAFQQPVGFPVLPLCSVALRRKCNLMINNNTACSCAARATSIIHWHTYRNNFSCTLWIINGRCWQTKWWSSSRPLCFKPVLFV